MKKKGIGVFDSGLGGLTAVKELMQIAPDEDIVYYGDTARVPYGNREKPTITRYAKQAIGFLLSKDIKMLVDACGTMSAVLKTEYTGGLPVPYVDVIDPTARAAHGVTKNGKIGVIATATTVKSGAFERALYALDPAIFVRSKACPLFVPLVEDGHIQPDNPVTRMVAEGYLAELKAEGVDTLILGCTHYPLLFDTIQAVMGDGVTLVNSGAEAAKAAFSLLQEQDRLNNDGGDGFEFYTTDNPIGFSKIATMFLGRELPGKIAQVDIDAYTPFDD